MKTLAVLLTAAWLVVCGAGMLLADTGAAGLMHMSGKVVSVNSWSNELVLEKKLFGLLPTGQKSAFVVTAQTDIADVEGQRSVPLSDLEPGDRVAIAYTMEHGKNMAKTITIREAAEPAATAATEEGAAPAPAESSVPR